MFVDLPSFVLDCIDKKYSMNSSLINYLFKIRTICAKMSYRYSYNTVHQNIWYSIEASIYSFVFAIIIIAN